METAMQTTIDRAFGEKFLKSIDDFYAYGVDWLFNEWWESAPAEAIAKYEAAILDHPEHGPLAREGWLAPDFTLASLDGYGPGTLGHAYRAFIVDNRLVERLAAGYHARHDELLRSGKIARMPPALAYKVLRGFQTHDLHHVLTGYPATPFGELSLQAFQLAQIHYPYASMWIAVVTGHMTLLDPYLIKPAMDAITDGWTLGCRARSLQFVRFEERLGDPLEAVQAEYGLLHDRRPVTTTPRERTPTLIAAAGGAG
jgi:ubiquinone biosynthesis protein Coq4